MRACYKKIFGLAKVLEMDNEDVHTVAYRETGKDSLRACTPKELDRIIQALVLMREGKVHVPGRITQRQLYKVKEYENLLGWAENPARLRAFCKKYYKVDQVEWLSVQKGIALIDSLKYLYEKQAAALEVEPC